MSLYDFISQNPQHRQDFERLTAQIRNTEPDTPDYQIAMNSLEDLLDKHFSGDSRDITNDPLTAKGEKIMKSMKEKYGEKKGKSVFYASANKGTITGVHDTARGMQQTFDVHFGMTRDRDIAVCRTMMEHDLQILLLDRFNRVRHFEHNQKE